MALCRNLENFLLQSLRTTWSIWIGHSEIWSFWGLLFTFEEFSKTIWMLGARKDALHRKSNLSVFDDPCARLTITFMIRAAIVWYQPIPSRSVQPGSVMIDFSCGLNNVERCECLSLITRVSLGLNEGRVKPLNSPKPSKGRKLLHSPQNTHNFEEKGHIMSVEMVLFRACP
jgi:hypothetical protein